MTTEPAQQDGIERDLLKVLVEHKVISQAQATLVQSDHESTGMTLEDILLARHWVDEDTLKNLAPWLGASGQTGMQQADKNSAAGATYEENLKKYRSLMAEILGESSE